MARYEGSPEDMRMDKKNAKKNKMSLKTYEKSAIDKKNDAKGQARLDKKARKGK